MQGLTIWLTAGLVAVTTTGMALADLPAPLLAEAEENIALCREVGGVPRLQGLQLAGVGMTAEVYQPYVTTLDLNGDGQADHIIDLAGLECEGAWSLFCGSAGCPVAIWISGPEGLQNRWGSHVQAWRLEDGVPVMSLHGQLCNPPRSGVEGCEITPDLGEGGAGGARGAHDGATKPGRSLRPRLRPDLGGDEKTASDVAEAGQTPALAPPPDPGSAAAPATGWSHGPMADGSGWQAGVADAERGTRIDWLCRKGEDAILALSPYRGDGGFSVSGGMRIVSYDVTVENGVAFTVIDIGSPLFLHIVSDSAFEVADGTGLMLGRFTMEGAPAAIGQAVGRCR